MVLLVFLIEEIHTHLYILFDLNYALYIYYRVV